MVFHIVSYVVDVDAFMSCSSSGDASSEYSSIVVVSALLATAPLSHLAPGRPACPADEFGLSW